MKNIHCPKCGCEFEISSLMDEHMEAELRARLQPELESKLAVATRAAEERVRAVNEDLAAARARIAGSEAREAELLRAQRESEEREQQNALAFERRVAEETRFIREQEGKVAQERSERDANERVRIKEEELTAARARLKEAAIREADLLKKERAIDERELQMALECERRVAAEIARTREHQAQLVEQRAELERERTRLLIEEQRQKNEGLEKTIDELQRKLRQGSQQAQGEVQEVLLRDLLAEAFELDTIDDVAKGTSGADVLQGVHAQDGRECGTIIWESKRTKAWSDDWLPKLRDDQRAAGAALAVIVTQTLPSGVRLFTEREGVWICSWASATALAVALRAGLIDASLARRVAEGRGEKMQMLFDYLTGSEFRHRVSGLAEALADMQEDFEQEKRAVLRIWKRRERQLGRSRDNLSAFYGDIQGIAGQKIVDLPALSLEAIATLPAHAGGDELLDDDEAGDDVGPPRTDDPALVRLLYSLIPADGTNVGNGTLCERFAEEALLKFGASVSMVDYERCKAMLLDRSRIRRGKGKGGSVARASTSNAGPHAADEASRHS
jgi:hypothetical protein